MAVGSFAGVVHDKVPAEVGGKDKGLGGGVDTRGRKLDSSHTGA